MNMKSVIFHIITDETFGIKVKDNIKFNILRMLDSTKDEVSCKFDPIQVNNDKITKACFNFYLSGDESYLIRYRIEENVKFLRAEHLPTDKNPNMIEDYIVISYSNGLTEYKTRYKCGTSNNYSMNEYYYNGKEISEEEASDLFNPKTK